MSQWDDLSMREKAAMMRVAVRNRMFDIDQIKEAYNSQNKQVSNSEVINPNQYTPSVNLNVNPALDYVGNALESISGYEYEGNPLNKLGIDMSFDLGTTGSSMYPNGIRFVKKFDEGGPKQNKYPTYSELMSNPKLYGLVQDTLDGKLIYRQSGDPEKAKWFYASRAEEAPNQIVDFPTIVPQKQVDNYDAKWFNYNQPATMNYISSQINNMQDPIDPVRQEEYRKQKQKELISWIPFVGDAVDLYDIGDNIYNGDYTSAAMGAGIMLLPEVIEKGVKSIYRSVRNLIKKNNADNVVDAVDNLGIPSTSQIDYDINQEVGLPPASQIDDDITQSPVSIPASPSRPEGADLNASGASTETPSHISNLNHRERLYLREYYAGRDINSLTLEEVEKPFKEMFQFRPGTTPNTTASTRSSQEIVDKLLSQEVSDFDPNYARETLGWSEKQIAEHQRMLDLLNREDVNGMQLEDFEYLFNQAKQRGLAFDPYYRNLSGQELLNRLNANEQKSKDFMSYMKRIFKGVPHEHRIRLTDDDLSKLSYEQFVELQNYTDDVLHYTAGRHGEDFWNYNGVHPAVNALSFALSRRNTNVLNDLMLMRNDINNAAISGNMLIPHDYMFSVDSYPIYLTHLAKQLKANEVVPISPKALLIPEHTQMTALGVSNQFNIPADVSNYVRKKLGQDINNDMKIADLQTLIADNFKVENGFDSEDRYIYKIFDGDAHIGTITRRKDDEVVNLLNQQIDDIFKGSDYHPGKVILTEYGSFLHPPFPVIVRKEGGAIDRLKSGGKINNYQHQKSYQTTDVLNLPPMTSLIKFDK